MNDRVQALRRTWYQWLVVAIGVLLGVVALALAVGFFVANRNASALGRVELGDVLAGRPASLDDGPVNVLLMGYSSMSSLGSTDVLRDDDLDAQRRAQAIMIVRLDPSIDTAMVLSIPSRTSSSSSEVTLAAVATLGGAEAAVEAVSNTLGVPIHHYAEMDLHDVDDLVDSVGGVSVSVPFAMRDERTQFLVNTQGCVTFDGESARRYLSSTAMEGRINDEWVSVAAEPGHSALDRERDLLAALARELPDGLANGFAGFGFWSDAANVLAVDDSLTRSDVMDLASRMQDYQRRNLYVFTLPVSAQADPASSVPLLDGTVAGDVLTVFRSPTSLPLGPAAESAIRPGMTGFRSLTCR